MTADDAIKMLVTKCFCEVASGISGREKPPKWAIAARDAAGEALQVIVDRANGRTFDPKEYGL